MGADQKIKYPSKNIGKSDLKILDPQRELTLEGDTSASFFCINDVTELYSLLKIFGDRTVQVGDNYNSPVFHIKSNINPTLKMTDGNSFEAALRQFYQGYIDNNLLSASFTISATGNPVGGSFEGSKLNNVIDTANWGSVNDPSKRGGFHIYFSLTPGDVDESNRALWVTPDNRMFIHNKIDDVVEDMPDSASVFAKDISGVSHIHLRGENGDEFPIFKQDLPSVPTNIEIANFLANLGLANLI